MGRSLVRMLVRVMHVRTGALLLVATGGGCRGEPPAPAPHVAVSPRADAQPAPESTVRTGGSENDVNALLTRSCQQCHAWSTPSLVRARSACRSGRPLVVPFSPERSPLYGKLSGAAECGGPMPPTGYLQKREIAAVREWILEGAPVDGKPSPVLVDEAAVPAVVESDPAMD